MGKKKKTREQKIIADLRNQLAQTAPSYTLSKTEEHRQEKHVYNPLQSPQTTVKVSNGTYAYLSHDLIKTGILTASLTGIQLVLFFLLKNHIVRIPMLSY